MTLSQLAIYPIKSTAQVSLDNCKMGAFGLDMDRRWMLINNEGYMLTQRKHPKMCLIKSRFEANQLVITAPGMEQLIIPTQYSGELISATVWDDVCNAHNCGQQAAQWFSHFLGISARLVYFPHEEVRQVDLDYAKQGNKTAFSDGFPYLLISQASLDDLNSRLAAPVDMRRFRPNLVINGTEAFAEDDWKAIRIGDITFNLVKPCSRCVIPSIDPETAKKSAEVVKTLAGYRMRENKIYFGQNLIAEDAGKLEVGMEVEILDTC
ncbi:MAG: MOSC domain-containing protein [endosymbiont of Galathealinum brachiosum]|uniref:MOSC domain-containing protein n=1 Tax=endosymbiont of Galathealinum brachiosum TaxID=2200906 RepID=A0A370D887_9GAMM|nr:MAG: MOSC domain-containing protein [endosymbiont of Galathealinum brachiosum]